MRDHNTLPKDNIFSQYSKPHRVSVNGLNLLSFCREEQYSPSQRYTKHHLIRAINLSVGSLVIAGLPHPPKEKYSLWDHNTLPKYNIFFQYSKPHRVSVNGLSLLLFCREEQYSPSQRYTKCHLIRAINLSMGSLVIAGSPHPPKEKYSL